MRYEVKIPASFFLGQNLNGRGTAYLSDFALVLEGDRYKLNIRILRIIAFGLVRDFMKVRSTLTIPYSVVIQYRCSRRFLYQYHRLVYRLPDGKLKKVKFRLLRKPDMAHFGFREKLQNYLQFNSLL